MPLKNWKTTLFGLIALVAVNGKVLGIPENITRIAEGVAIALGFGAAKDRDVTGVGTNARHEGE